ncbi:MAG: site-2 protease family protein [Gemmataceae bacterium]|nr:site-2 protease family protein [Gemmataceae bacterium]
MRDPFSWSFPLVRVFGITVRVHVLFPLFALAMILRVAFHKDYQGTTLWVDTAVIMGLLFVIVLLHEFGHCFGARLVEGDAHEILMWPLGGLAAIEVPHTPRANFIAAAAGPAVNLLLCVATGLILAAHSLMPPLNPLSWEDAYAPKLKRWSDNTVYGGKTFNPGDPIYFGYQELGPGNELIRVDPAAADKAPERFEKVRLAPDQVTTKDGVPYWAGTKIPVRTERATLAWSEILVARIFWLNWFLLLLNLLPGFPLDGGRMFQCVLWWRTDYRQATLAAVFAGFVVMVIIGLFGVVTNEVMPILLAMFIYVTCKHQWFVLETGGEEQLFGYDFSQGYTSLERGDQPPTPRRRRPNFIQRWLQRRAQRKAQRAQETREAEERRMDELLEKVQRDGLQALTDEERRFLTRVSARYRNRH